MVYLGNPGEDNLAGSIGEIVVPVDSEEAIFNETGIREAGLSGLGALPKEDQCGGEQQARRHLTEMDRSEILEPSDTFAFCHCYAHCRWKRLNLGQYGTENLSLHLLSN